MKRNRVKPSANKKTNSSIKPNASFPKNPTLAIYLNQFIVWDTSLCIHINRYSTNHMIAAFFKGISRLGDGWFWYVMLFTALVAHGTSAILPLVVTMLLSATGLAVYKILKLKTVRPRPYQVHQVIVLGERPLDVFSFPSGHTLQAVLFTATLGSYYRAATDYVAVCYLGCIVSHRARSALSNRCLGGCWHRLRAVIMDDQFASADCPKPAVLNVLVVY